MITTFVKFIQELPENVFLVCEGGEEPSVYPIEEGIAGMDWENPNLYREVLVLWNEESTITLVTSIRPDPACMVIKNKSVVFEAK